MPSDDCGDFNRKLVLLLLKIVVTEVEVSNVNVFVERIDQVASTLIADTAMRNIQVTQGEI